MDVTLYLTASPEAMTALLEMLDLWRMAYPRTIVTIPDVVVPPDEHVSSSLVNQLAGGRFGLGLTTLEGANDGTTPSIP